jgi:hypothetical protein
MIRRTSRGPYVTCPAGVPGGIWMAHPADAFVINTHPAHRA